MLSEKTKKEYPLEVVRRLESLIDKVRQRGLVKIVDEKGSGGSLITVVDRDENSMFGFSVTRYRVSGSTLYLDVEYAPESRNSIEKCSTTLWSSDVERRFDEWYKLIEEYERVQIFSDDPITDFYAREYYARFEIVDEDAWKPLEHDKMVLLDERLKFLVDNIERYANDDNAPQIAEMQEMASNIREKLPNEPQGEVFKQISVLLVMLMKIAGLFMLKEFFGELVKVLLVEPAVKALIP